MSIEADKLHYGILAAKLDLKRANKTLKELLSKCPHSIESHYLSEESYIAFCTVCEEYFGWYCPTSPTKLCEYKQPDGGYNEDNCVYCHLSEERK